MSRSHDPQETVQNVAPPRILLNSMSNSPDSLLRSAAETPVKAMSPSSTPQTPAQQRLNDDRELIYKHIHIKKQNGENVAGSPGPISRRWKKTVSFDTISVEQQDPVSADGRGHRGRSRTRSPGLESDSRFPFTDPSDLDGRSISPSPVRFREELLELNQKLSMKTLGNIDSTGKSAPQIDERGFRVDYPSSPDIVDDSFTLNSTPAAPLKKGKTWVVYITGRRHTWVSLDYVVSRLLKAGDYLVVVSRVPSYGVDEDTKKNGFKDATSRIRRYIENISDPAIAFKLTIDLFLGDKTDAILSDCVKIYSPHALVVSFKPSSRYLDSQSWLNTSRISHRLIKNFPLPVLIVPVLSTNRFEVQLFEELSKEHGWTVNTSCLKQRLLELDLRKSLLPDSELDKLLNRRLKEIAEKKSVSRAQSNDDDNESVTSNQSDSDDESGTSSINSQSSTASRDPYLRLTETVKRSRTELDDHFRHVSAEPVGNAWFMDNLIKVSDIAFAVSDKLEQASHCDDETANLVRTLTGMPTIERHKSMLDVGDTDEAASTSGKDAVNRLRKQLTHSVSSSAGNLPTAHSSSSTLKWDLKTDLRKTQSHIPDFKETSATRFTSNLGPSKSHDPSPQRQAISQKSNTGSSKKGFLRSLFRKN